MTMNNRVKAVHESKAESSELIMPNDTNPLGNLMGGNLMRFMDVIGGICAARHCESHVVTASVDHVTFGAPIHLGDVITLKACVTHAFNTSVEVYVEVTASKMGSQEPKKTNHAYLTFVAIDKNTMRPKLIPKVKPETKEEKLRYESAPRRREIRLILAGRIEAKDAVLVKEYFGNL